MTIELSNHHNILAIVIDKKFHATDSLEFFINAQDVARKVPIYIPDHFCFAEDWSTVSILGKIITYNKSDCTLKPQIKSLLENSQ